MRNLRLFFIGACVLIVANASAQHVSESEVPQQVLVSFHKQFPNVTNRTWGIDTHYYEASFMIGDKSESAIYDRNGAWIQTETDIETDDLPAAVKKTIAKDFAGYDVNDASEVRTAAGKKYYQLEVEHGDDTYDVDIGAAGNVISKTKDSDD